MGSAAAHAFDSTIVVVRAGGCEGVGSGDAMLGLAGHEDLFVGQDVFDIERHVALLDNLQFHYGRMWPLEIALWDLAGKLRGEPLWRMLGGETSRVRVYASTGERVSAEERAASAVRCGMRGSRRSSCGFTPTIRPTTSPLCERCAMPSVLTMEILVDANQGWRMPWDTSPSWDYETALQVADELSGLGVYWLEEPLTGTTTAGWRSCGCGRR